MADMMSYTAEKPAVEQEISRLEIEFADNGGFIGRCYYQPKKSKKMDVMAYQEPEKVALQDRDELDKWIDSKIGVED